MAGAEAGVGAVAVVATGVAGVAGTAGAAGRAGAAVAGEAEVEVEDEVEGDASEVWAPATPEAPTPAPTSSRGAGRVCVVHAAPSQ